MRVLKQAEPTWETLFPAEGGKPAVEVLFAPVTRQMRRNAKAAVREMILSGVEIESASPELLDDVGEAVSIAFLRQGIIDWRGIGDADGEPIAVSPEAIEMFLADDDLFAAADRIYVGPIIERDREKNGLSASPNGIGEAETPAKIIAGSPAEPTRKAGAKNAPTGKTSPGRRKGRTPGTSSKAVPGN